MIGDLRKYRTHGSILCVSGCGGLLVCGITLFAQFALVAITFPLTELWTDVPLFHIDGAYHWYEMKLAAAFAVTGNVVGYDPFFAAGHPDGIIYNASAKLPALLAVIFSPGISEIRLYKSFVFLAATLAPVAIPCAAMVLGCSKSNALLAAIFGLFMWWVSYFHWYFTAGMVGYVASCYLGLLFAVLIFRFLEGRGSAHGYIGIGLVGAAGFFVHPVFPIPVAFLVLAFLAINGAHIQTNRLAPALVLIPIASLLPNLIWMWPTYHFQQVFPLDMDQPYQQIVNVSLLWQELIGVLRGDAHGSKLYIVLVVGAIWACKSEGSRIPRVLFLAAIGLEVFAYLGASIPWVGKLAQPNRFGPAGYLLLCIPAAQGFGSMVRTLSKHSSRAWRAFAGLGVAGSAAICCVLIFELAREVSPGPHGRYGAAPPYVRPLGAEASWVIDWLRRRTTADARVMFEISLGGAHGQAHMAGYFAHTAQREFIGGPYPFMNFAGFWDGWVFGKQLSAIPYERMNEYLNLYNVGYIIVHSDVAKQYFDKMPRINLDGEYGKLRAYITREPHSYFLRGSGRIENRSHNSLLLTDVSDSEIVLKYHYVPGMVADPPIRIEGVRMLDDPHLFVRIENPPRQLRLYMP